MGWTKEAPTKPGEYRVKIGEGGKRRQETVYLYRKEDGEIDVAIRMGLRWALYPNVEAFVSDNPSVLWRGPVSMVKEDA